MAASPQRLDNNKLAAVARRALFVAQLLDTVRLADLQLQDKNGNIIDGAGKF